MIWVQRISWFWSNHWAYLNSKLKLFFTWIWADFFPEEWAGFSQILGWFEPKDLADSSLTIKLILWSKIGLILSPKIEMIRAQILSIKFGLEKRRYQIFQHKDWAQSLSPKFESSSVNSIQIPHAELKLVTENNTFRYENQKMFKIGQ